jgi:hypothetical protein
MPAGNRGLDLSADEVALMSQLGIAEARIREILATEEVCASEATSEAPPAHPSGLSVTERGILRRGGARGLDDRRQFIVGVKGRISKPSSKRVGRSSRPLRTPPPWPRSFICQKKRWRTKPITSHRNCPQSSYPQ